MKATALLLCGLALATAAPNPNSPYTEKADKQFLTKQQDIAQLFTSFYQPFSTQKQQQQASSFNFQQQQQNSVNPNAVRRFQNSYQQSYYLPRGEVFNYNNPNHLEQAIQLFNLFYFAKDYNTFYQAAAWARNNINEGVFAYALSVAVLNRPDTQGVALFSQAEIHPYYYINAQAIQQAQNYKQQGQKQARVLSNFTEDVFVCTGRHQPNDYFFNSQNQNQDSEFYANQYQNQNQNQNEYYMEGRPSYYNEDINLNQQFAFEQLKNPAWFNSQKYQNKQQNQNQNNGENFYYYLQQALARYNLERYANDLPNVQPFQFNQNIQRGYNPQLQYHNGQVAPARPNNYPVNNANPNVLQQFQNIDRRIADVVNNLEAQAADGSKVKLNAENGIQVLANLMQNNENSVNNQYYGASNGFYGYIDQCRRVIASTSYNFYLNNNAPAPIDNDHSANRDPAFYQCISRAVNYFQNFKTQQKPYSQEQLNFQGVKVQNVNVDRLVSTFDEAEVSLLNAIHYHQGEVQQGVQYKAVQGQLNSKPFNYQIQVDSNQEANAIVRVFIGPKYDAIKGQQYSLEQVRQNFVEIDRFTVSLKQGQNNIQRSSQQSTRFVQQQQVSASDLYSHLRQAITSGSEFLYYKNYAQQQAVFPQNLILPKGQKQGQDYVFAVAVNAYQGNQQDQQNEQEQPIDNRPQGFPFDRIAVQANFEQAKNIHFQSVKIFNHDKNQ